MIKNPELSDFSLLSSKKPAPAPFRRTRGDFESDYRQEIIKNQKTLNPEYAAMRSKMSLPVRLEENGSYDAKQKALEANLNLPQTPYNDVFVNETKQRLLMKADLLHKCKRVSEKVDIYLEQDEKLIDVKALKDMPGSINDEYECFDSDIYFFNSVAIPQSFHEFHAQNKQNKADARVLKGILAEINCVYLVIDRSLYLWRYMEDTNLAEEIQIEKIYSQNLEKSPAKIFTFGPYEEEIRAVAICVPTLHIFLQADIKLLLVIAFSTTIQIFNLKIDEKSIAMDSLEISVKVKGEIDCVVCSKSGRIFYGCSNGKIREIDYKESKIWGLITYKKGFYSKECKKSLKSHLKDYLSITYSIFTPPKYLKMISIDNMRYILYALLETGHQCENSEIVVYDLGGKNDGFQKIFTITSDRLKQKLKDHGQKVDYFDATELKIIFVAALDETYSKDVHLLLITKNGLRIYISLQMRPFTNVEPFLCKYAGLDRPIDDFDVYFVKWPIILPNKKSVGHLGLLNEKRSRIGSTQQSRKMINGFLSKNTCFMIESNDHMTINQDIPFKTIYFYALSSFKLAVTPDLEASSDRQRIENAGIVRLSSDYYYDDLEICKIPEKALVSSTVSQLLELKKQGSMINKEFFLGGKTGSFSFECLSELSRQVYLPPSHFLFLTSESLDFVMKARPIDLLFQILSLSPQESSLDEFEFNKFVAYYGGIETCCMLLEIICNSDMIYFFSETLDKKLKEDYLIRTKQNLYREKAAGVADIRQNIRCIKASEEIVNKAVIAFFKVGDSVPESKPQSSERRDFLEPYGRVVQPEQKRYTFKIEGFLLYFSRLIRPVWNKKIVEKSVYECLIYDRLENFLEDELHLVRKRVLEIKNFIDSKNDRLLIRRMTPKAEEMKQSEKKNVLDFGSAQKVPVEAGQELLTTPNPKIVNVEEIIWDEKNFLEDYYRFLDKTIQTIDLLIFFVISHNLKNILNMIPSDDRRDFLSLTFNEIFREINIQKPIKSILTAFLKRNLHDSKNITNYFLLHFSDFYTESDSNISQAEQLFEVSLKTLADNVDERKKYISKGLVLLQDNVAIMSYPQLESIYQGYLAKFGTYWESVILFVRYINNMNLLEEGLKISQKERIEKREIFGNKIEFFLSNIQQYKESSRNMIVHIIAKIYQTKHHLLNKSLLNFAKKAPDIIRNLNVEESNSLFERCLREIFKSFDEELHKKVLRWLFDEKLFEEILSIESKYVEEILLEETDKNFKEKYMTLYKYYINKGDHLKASRIATRISLHDQSEMMASENDHSELVKEFIVPEESVIKIEERLKFMNFAIHELENYLQTLDSREKDYAKQIEKKKDLLLNQKHLQIQGKVIEELEEINQETKEYLTFYSKSSEHQAICQKLMKEKTEIEFNISYLNRKVLDIEDLKETYIENYAMFACKLFIYDYAENEIPEDNVIKIYETIFSNIYQETLKNNHWKPNVQRKLKFIYFNLTKKRKKLFPLKQIVTLLENFNQVHPCFLSYQENLIEILTKKDKKWSNEAIPQSPFWIAEFLNISLNIKMFELLSIYERYFNDNSENYEKEVELMDGQEVTPRNIENFIYALNVLLYVIEYLLKSVKSDIQTVISDTGGKTQIIESQNNIREYMNRASQIDSLLFACFNKLDVLRKMNHFDTKIIQVLEIIIKKLSDDLRKINERMSLINFVQDEAENDDRLPFTIREPQGSFRDSSFGQEPDMQFLNQSFNANGIEEQSGKKEKKQSKYDLTNRPI